MKRLLYILVLGLVLNGCSNEFELTENWKEITVVYGMLNQADTAQYIRIEKAFLDDETSAFVLAQEADSLFYNDISVELQEAPASGSGTGQLIVMERVDANLEGFQKEDGIFATSPNWVYKTTEALDEEAIYKLVINNNETDNTVTASTRICEDFDLFNPIEGTTLRIEPGKNLTLVWKVKPNSLFFDGYLRMYYTEQEIGNPASLVTKTLDWPIFKNFKPGEINTVVTVRIETDNFYSFVGSSLEAIPNIQRSVVSADIVLNSGGEDLLNYIDVGLANTGITGSETLPTYTNLSEGFGVFSSRYSKSFTGFQIGEVAQDTLSNGQYTKDLGF